MTKRMNGHCHRRQHHRYEYEIEMGLNAVSSRLLHPTGGGGEYMSSNSLNDLGSIGWRDVCDCAKDGGGTA